jgi:capsular polysaccharide transport system permease protein
MTMQAIARKHPYWAVSIAATFVAAAYWSLWATDRYVSEAHVVLQSAQIASPSFNFASILKGGTSHDLLMLRDHLLSVDMLKKLDDTLDLRSHYADRKIDRLSRLRSADVPLEQLHRYYSRRIHVNLDEYAQVLRVQAQAYDPDMAHAIVQTLLSAGEAHMNAMGQRLAAEQVRFIEVQVEALNERLSVAREGLLAYQNVHGLVSPTSTVESLSAVVAALEGELAKTHARRDALGASQSERSAEMVRLNNEIDAIESQIRTVLARMAANSGGALNRLSADYETLRHEAEFAREIYANALGALENTRVEAARTLKQVSVLQNPTMPEFATEPRRLYNISVFGILSTLAGLIAHLLAAIVRDHRD